MTQPSLPFDVVWLIIDMIGRRAMTRGSYARRTASAEQDHDNNMTWQSLSALSLLSKHTLDRCRHWIFRCITLAPKPNQQIRLGKLKELEEGLATAAKVIFQEGYTDQLGRKPGDYVHSLSLSFPIDIHWKDGAHRLELAHQVVIGSGFAVILREYPNVNNLQLDGAGGERMFFTQLGGPAFCDAVSRLPLQRFCVKNMGFPQPLLQSLPETLQSLRMAGVYLVGEDQEVQTPGAQADALGAVSSTWIMAPLSDRVSFDYVGRKLRSILSHQAQMSPGIFDNIKRLSYGISNTTGAEFELLHDILAGASNTVESLELNYSELQDYTVAKLTSSLATFPHMTALRSLTIACPKRPFQDEPLQRRFGSNYILSHINTLKTVMRSLPTLKIDIVDLGFFAFSKLLSRFIALPTPLTLPISSESLYQNPPIFDPVECGFSEVDELLSDTTTFASLERLHVKFQIRLVSGDRSLPQPRGLVRLFQGQMDYGIKLFQREMVKQLCGAFEKTVSRLGGNFRIETHWIGLGEKYASPQAQLVLGDSRSSEFWCPR